MSSNAQGENTMEEKILAVTDVPTLNVINTKSSVPVPAPQAQNVPLLKETVQTRPEPKLEPPTVKKCDLQVKYLILESLFRTPLTIKPEFTISTYVPDSALMYYKINIMDRLMFDNEYFRRQCQYWHPFVSRLYFGVLFYIQTLRAQEQAGRISENQKTFLHDFLDLYPANSLTIPGPLVLTFKSLSSSKSEIGRSGLVTPAIPDYLGTTSVDSLITDATPHLLQLPHIPGLLAFMSTIVNANQYEIPDYSMPDTFDNSQNRTLLGHTFTANAWTLQEREFLLNPALTYPTASDEDSDNALRDYCQFINDIDLLVDIECHQDIRGFMIMDTTMEWFEPIRQIMSDYRCYFNAKTNLNAISPHGTQSSLIYSVRQTGRPVRNNTYLTRRMTHAFNDSTVFSFTAQHFTAEPSIPEAVSLIACSAQTNVKYSLTAATDDFENLCTRAPLRQGPYWNRHPIWNQTVVESNYLKTRDIITQSFFIDKP